MSDKKWSRDQERVRIRRTWIIDPQERIHSTPKGKKGYDRHEFKQEGRNWQNRLNEDME